MLWFHPEREISGLDGLHVHRVMLSVLSVCDHEAKLTGKMNSTHFVKNLSKAAHLLHASQEELLIYTLLRRQNQFQFSVINVSNRWRAVKLPTLRLLDGDEREE